MKLFYKEDKDFLSPEDKHTLDEITLHGFFPFHLQKNTYNIPLQYRRIPLDNSHFIGVFIYKS